MNDIIILGMLLEGPKHGYRLKQDAPIFSGEHELHSNTVYPMLRRFLRDGWIKRREAPGERGQTRLLYELTAAGKKALIRRLSGFTDADAASDQAFRLRVGMFQLLKRDDREHILLLRDANLTGRLERLKEIARSPKLDSWSATTVGFLIKQLERERRWISQIRSKI